MATKSVVILDFQALTSKASAAVTSFAGTVGVLRKNLNALAGPVNAFLGPLVGIAAVGSMVKLGKDTLQTADNLAKFSKQTGISIETLSAWKHGAELSGETISGLQVGIRRFAQSIKDASDGIKEAKDSFDLLGVSVVDQDGNLKQIEQVMGEVADGFQKLPDGVQKTDAALALFGRSGAKLIPFLNGGSEGLAQFRDEADRLGLVIGAEFGSNAELLNDNLLRIGRQANGLTTQFLTGLVPALSALTGEMVTADNRSEALVVAGEKLGNWIKGVVTVIDSLVTGFKSATILFEVAIAQVVLISKSFALLVQVAGLVVDSLANIAEVFRDVFGQLEHFGKAIDAVLRRDFKTASLEARKGLEGIKGGFADLFLEGAELSSDAIGLVKNFAADAGAVVETTTQSVIDGLTAQYDGLADRVKNRFSGEADGSGDAVPVINDDQVKRENEKAAGIREAIENQLAMIEATRMGFLARQTEAENQRHAAELDRIDELQIAHEEAQMLREEAEVLHQERLYDINLEAQERMRELEEREAMRKAFIRDQQLRGTQAMFGDMATAAKAFGKKGFEAYKAFAIAATLIETYRSAVSAYASVVGIPYVGPFLAPVAAAAAVAAGIAQVQQIRAQQFQEGGVVAGGRQLIEVNEDGRPEGVVNATGLANIGVANLNAINSGLITAADFINTAPSTISSAIDIDSFTEGSEFGAGSSGRGGRGGSGRPWLVALVDSRADAEAMGADEIIEVVKGRRVEVGVST